MGRVDKLKKIVACTVLLILVSGLAFSQVKGPILDKILFDAKTQEDIGLKDVASGRSDLWNYGTSGSAFKALPDDIKSKLEVYGITGVASISLLFNPYPNKAPYVTTPQAGAKAQFNPFAIREIRYAFNFLINRKKIIDEIMVGAGAPMFTPATPGQPNASKFGMIASKYGFTASGNEKKALVDIAAAMQKAADLSENKGKLIKNGQWWSYNGEPVTIKFLIRVDDPNLRLPEGRYIADLIEKAGIKVERLEYDRSKCLKIYNQGDPRDYQWNLYTEAFLGGQTYAFWETSISQMYAPWFAQMPGGGTAGFWQYQQAEIDTLTQDAINGRIKNSAEYYDKLTKAVELGIKEAVRVMLATQTTYYVANKERFNARMVYGIGDGLNKWSLYAADVKAESSGPDQGLKVLRMSNFSSRGSLFYSSWDPIGTGGFADSYSSTVTKECSDSEMEGNPVTGIFMNVRADYTGLKNSVDIASDGKITGKIAVPAKAVLWNARNQKWESGINYVDVKKNGSVFDYAKVSNNLAWASATFSFKYGAWHHGRAVDINDYRYTQAFAYDISVKKSPNDRVYEPEFAGTVNPGLTRSKGLIFNADNTITSYGDSNYPMDAPTLAAMLCPSLMVQASNHGAIVPWEILEALKGIVSEGSASKTVYSYNSNSDFTEVDLISQKCVADLKAKLKEYIVAKHIPAALVGYISVETVVKDYQLTLAFLEKHGHGYISNGAFYFDSYDPSNNTGSLLAFRDPTYPYEKGY